MGRPKKNMVATAKETSTPPSDLATNHVVAKIVKGEGNNLWSVVLPGGNGNLLVELPTRLRKTIWLKRGGYVVIDRTVFEDRENKLGGEIVNIVRDEKDWRKQPYWPKEFAKAHPIPQDSDDDEEPNTAELSPLDDSDNER